MTVFDQYPTFHDYWYGIGCFLSANETQSIYRTIVASTTTGSRSQASSTSQPPTPGSVSSAAASEPSITSSAMVTSTITTEPQPSISSQSKAWIAGPITGGVAILLVMGAFLWRWMKKNKKNKTDSPDQNLAKDANIAQQAAMAQTGYPHPQSPSIQYSPYYPPLSSISPVQHCPPSSSISPVQHHTTHDSILSGTETVTASIMSGWEGQGLSAPPPPIYELDSEKATTKYHHEAPVIAEAPSTEHPPAAEGQENKDAIAEAP